MHVLRREDSFVRDALALFASLPWALTRRRPISPEIEQMREAVRRSEASDDHCQADQDAFTPPT
jgi:hypothetical protein